MSDYLGLDPAAMAVLTAHRLTDAASMCGSWAGVQAGKYFLAECVSDLKAIMGLKNDEHHCTTPISICDGLDRHIPDNLFRKCQCGKMTGSKVERSDVVQVLAPPPTVELKHYPVLDDLGRTS